MRISKSNSLLFHQQANNPGIFFSHSMGHIPKVGKIMTVLNNFYKKFANRLFILLSLQIIIKFKAMNPKSFSVSILVGFLSISILLSCSKSEQKYDPFAEAEMLPVKVIGDDNYSMYKPDGTILYRNMLPSEPTAVTEGIFSMKTPDGVALYQAKPDEVTMLCNGLVAAGTASNGTIPVVRPGNRIEFLDLRANSITTLMPHNGYEITHAYYKFSDHLLPVCTDERKWGYVNVNGEWIIEPQYDYAYPFSEKKAVVMYNATDDTSARYFIIDESGKVLYTLPDNLYCYNKEFKYGELLCKEVNNGPVYRLPDNFKLSKIEPSIMYVFERSQKYGVFSFGEFRERGVIDSQDKEIIDTKHYEVNITYHNQFLVSDEKNSNWKILDDKANVVKDLSSAKSAYSFGRYGIIINENNALKFLDPEQFVPVNDNNLFSFISDNIPNSTFIYSQYFDWTSFAQDIVGMIKENGIGKYSLGNLATNMLSNPSVVEKDPIVFLHDLDLVKRGYKADVAAAFTTNEFMLLFSLFTGDLEYKLDLLSINFTTDAQTTAETASALKTAFINAGFKQVDATNSGASHYAAVYERDKIGAYVEFVPGETTGTVNLYRSYLTDRTKKFCDTISGYNR